MTTDEKTDNRVLKSVSTAFDIIEYLQDEGPATLSDIGSQFGMPPSTAHIHLVTLVENDYVIKKDNTYRCSLKFLSTGGELREQSPLFQAAKAEIDDLQQRTGEIANLATIENGYMVKLYKSEDVDSIDDRSPLGTYLHMHATAMGKAILAHLPDEEVDEILDHHGLPEMTDRTTTDREELFENLADVRERGYALNRGEHYEGVCAVSVPILSNRDGVLGSMCVSGPLSRMDSDRIQETLVPELRNKKNIIELKLE